MPTEFDLIEWIRKEARVDVPEVILGIGDDAAVLSCPENSLISVSQDLLIENIHFRRRWSSPAFIGRKALLANLSDLAAMGARPLACLLGLTLPSDLTGEFFEELLSGFLFESQQWNCPLVGGDLSKGDSVSLSVTVIGTHQATYPVTRRGATPGDLVVLVGDVGWALRGLRILMREDPGDLAAVKEVEALHHWCKDDFRFRCLRSHLLPTPQIEASQWIAQMRLANAMIDVSDGLASDALRLAREGDCAIEIQVGDLAVIGSAAPDEFRATLESGEDYALLLTVSAPRYQELHPHYPAHLPPPRVIGRVLEGQPDLRLIWEGRAVNWSLRGYDHFRE